MQRLAALAPRPRSHLIRFHGVLAPHAKLRPGIIPRAPLDTNTHSTKFPSFLPARLERRDGLDAQPLDLAPQGLARQTPIHQRSDLHGARRGQRLCEERALRIGPFGEPRAAARIGLAREQEEVEVFGPSQGVEAL